MDELEVNLAIAQGTPTIDSMGTLFREEEFHRALQEGALSALPIDERNLVTSAYLRMNRANQLVRGVTNSPPLPNQSGRPLDRAWHAVRDCLQLIEAVRAGLILLLK